MPTDEAGFRYRPSRCLVLRCSRTDRREPALVAELLEPSQDVRGNASSPVTTHGDDPQVDKRWLTVAHSRLTGSQHLSFHTQSVELAAPDQILEIADEPVAGVLLEAGALKIGNHFQFVGLDKLEGHLVAPSNSGALPSWITAS